MLNHEVASSIGGGADQSVGSPRPLHLQSQALLDGIRHLLPALRHEVSDQLISEGMLPSVLARRTSLTGVPDRLFDGSLLCPPTKQVERLVDETVFTSLLCAVFCEALRQTYQITCVLALLESCIPELRAYTWFVPSQLLRSRLDFLLTSCVLSPIPIYLAGDIYEGALTKEEKKALGQYYTPPALVNHLLDQAGYVAGLGISGKSLLDVATGFGVFLAQAAKRLVWELQQQGSDLKRIFEAVEQHLLGYDVNPFAVVATKFHILATLLDALDLDPQRVCEALTVFRLPGVCIADALAQPFLPGADAPPHFVVGNPPYGTCKQGLHLERYAEVLDGRANLYQLFLYFAIQRSIDGGRIAFLMPESLRSGRYFTALRRYLATYTRLLATTDIQARTSVFTDVEQGVLILACEKGGSTHLHRSPDEVTVVQTADEEMLTEATPFLVPHHHVQMPEPMDYMLLKAGSRADYALLSRLCQQHTSASCIDVGVHTGRFVWNQHRDVFHGSSGDDSLPVIYAQSVHRFTFTFPPGRNNGERHQLLYSEQTPEALRYTTRGCVLLVQRTTAREQDWRLIATVVPEVFARAHPVYLVENHVNYIDEATWHGEDVPLLSVLGLLNSKLINFLFAALSGITHVSSWELRHLPLVYQKQTRLEELVARRLAVPQHEGALLEQQIDEAVYDIYRLSEEERVLVELFHQYKHRRNGRRVARQK